MSSTKRRRLDADTASNASGGGGGRNNAASSNGNAGSGRRGGGGPGSRGGHSAATASRAAAAASAVVPASSGITPPSSLPGGQLAAQPYVPVLPLSTLPTSALSKYALHYGLVPPEPLTVAQATFPTPALPLKLKLADSYTVPAQRGRTSTAEGRRNRSPYVSVRGFHQPSPSTSSVQPAAVRASGEQRSEEHSDADPSSSGLAVNGINGTASGVTLTPTNALGNSRSSSNSGGNPQQQHVLYVQTAEWTDPGEADAQEMRGMTAFEGGEEQLKDRLGSLARTHWDKLASIKEAETVVNFAYAVRMRSKILKSAPMV